MRNGSIRIIISVQVHNQTKTTNTKLLIHAKTDKKLS